MQVRRASRGPFLKQPYFSDSDIDGMCLDELTRQNLLPKDPAPIRIDRFIEKRFGRAHGYADLPDGILGVTKFGSNGVQEIILATALEDDRSRPSERRLRSTLAHETGHALLHAHLFALDQRQGVIGDWSDPKAPKVLCREPGEYNGQWWEYQANMLMGAILLPKHLVQRALSPYLREEGSFSIPSLSADARLGAIRDLSDIFDVNPVVVRIRLEKLVPAVSGGQMSL
jgi:IrrE N-terminal-like domain